MTLSLFDQFESPVWLGVPLVVVAIVLPLILLPKPISRWVLNRLLSIQAWFLRSFTQQIFLPIKTQGQKWAVLLGALMMFLITLNVLGLLPYTYTPTTQLSLTLAFALPLWLATVLLGFRTQPNIALSHFLPMGTPGPLIPVLIIIETISLFIRPVALAVRLTANLTAGHLLLHLISSAAFTLLPTMPVVAMLTAVLLLLLTLLEIAVAMIQAYVFVLLLSLYLHENV
nr:ATP synthase protein 6 [Chromis vanderbilti]